MGVIIPREGPFATWLAERIEDIVVLLLLPLYFTYSGLRTALGSLDSWVFYFYFILFYFIFFFFQISQLYYNWHGYIDCIIGYRRGATGPSKSLWCCSRPLVGMVFLGCRQG